MTDNASLPAWRRRPGAMATATAALLAAAAIGHAQPAPPGGEAGILPLTRIGPAGSGYLADPQPIHQAQASGNRVQMLSGTTKAVIACAYPIRPGCFTWTPITVGLGALGSQIGAAGGEKTNIQNVDLFQDDRGGWHAAVTIGVKTPQHPKHWTVIAHAHPVGGEPDGGLPLSWEADTVLTGSFSKPVEGNYDGKYVVDGGHLYLLYVDTIAPPPALRNAIFLQPMDSFTQPSATPRTMLLRPGAFASETYARTQAKLVEAPYLSKIAGRYALVYSTGAYLTPGYKAGVAWSDTLMPAAGQLYRKVLLPDGGHEVRYLIQSARPRWPDFTGAQVIGPGVAAAVQGPAGAWWLYFNGFAPDDRPTGQNGQVEGDHRRPYAVRLRVQVPPGRPVQSVSDADLASWMQPALP